MEAQLEEKNQELQRVRVWEVESRPGQREGGLTGLFSQLGCQPPLDACYVY